MNATTVLQSAFASHQAGDFDQAIRLYEQVLDLEPEHPDALNLLGVVHSQRKEYPRAIALLMKAVAAKPEFVDAWLNLAKTLSSVRRLKEAVGACDVVLRLQPRHLEALSTQARSLKKLKLHQAALDAARAVLGIDPNAHEMARLEAGCLVDLGRLEEAKACYEQCLRQQPGELALGNDFAMLLSQMGRENDAIAMLDPLTRLAEPYLPACSNLGNLLYGRGEHQRALALHQLVVSRNPRLYAGWINYANILQQEEQFAQAREALEKAIELQPDRSEAFVNLSGVLMGLDHEQQARQTLLKAIDMAPDFPDAWNNLAAMELDGARPDKAQRAYAQAVKLDPTLAAGQFGLALSLLMQGDFANGWPLYEWRWLGASQSKPKERPRFACPQWTGQATRPDTESIVVYHEQGFGDTVQFVRFAPALVTKFARVVLVVQPQLHALVARNMPAQIEVLTSEQGQDRVRQQAFHWHCPMGSLPLAMQLKDSRDIPGVSGYLAPLPDRPAPDEFLQALQQATSRHMPVIGLCWAGNPGLAHNKTRSLALTMFSELIRETGACWVSLQRERSDEEAGLLRELGVLDLSASLHDFSDTAAVIQRLDLVISVDTVLVHLAGALGVPVWLLNRYQSEWRWMLGSQDSVWYRSVRQFRQPRRKAWAEVLQDVGQALAKQFSGARK